ncbi:MAG TPA: MoaD/ThiS family protein [Geobacteraceae bacterium]
MHITVKLFATFRVGRFTVATQEHPGGTLIAAVIEGLQIPETQIGMIMVNGRHSEPDQLLHDGDSLALFPLVGGG